MTRPPTTIGFAPSVSRIATSRVRSATDPREQSINAQRREQRRQPPKKTRIVISSRGSAVRVAYRSPQVCAGAIGTPGVSGLL
jgi:hypothetical protein